MRKPVSLMIGSIAAQALTFHLMALSSYPLLWQDKMRSYLAAAGALASDDLDKARAGLMSLAGQSQGNLRIRAEFAAAAPDLMTMRTAFREVSEEAIALGVPPEYEVIICRMFRGSSRWIQKRGSIANPYWGKTMLTCGTPESSPEMGPLPVELLMPR